MTLAFLALLGAPYIYDISSLRVKYECMRQRAADDKWTECELIVNFGKIHIDPVT